MRFSGQEDLLEQANDNQDWMWYGDEWDQQAEFYYDPSLKRLVNPYTGEQIGEY